MEEQRGSRHTEHVAEIGTGAHQQVLHDIAERLAAQNPTVQYGQAAFEEDDLGGVLATSTALATEIPTLPHVAARR
jgi:hypothetical protein